jgi:RimJ/RimL family protein N-acetyltransferase
MIRGDVDGMMYWDWPADVTVDETHRAADFMLADVQSRDAHFWTARRRVDRDFVGVFDLSDIRSAGADLGFMVLRRFQGQGYAFEAASRVVAEAETLGLSRLKARIHLGNARSQRLLERLRFQFVTERDIEIRVGIHRRCAIFQLDL